jgi:hypothetical protein
MFIKKASTNADSAGPINPDVTTIVNRCACRVSLNANTGHRHRDLAAELPHLPSMKSLQVREVETQAPGASLNPRPVLTLRLLPQEAHPPAGADVFPVRSCP